MTALFLDDFTADLAGVFLADLAGVFLELLAICLVLVPLLAEGLDELFLADLTGVVALTGVEGLATGAD